MIDQKYGKVTLENKPDAPEDEPCFVLRAQDKLAPLVIRIYGEVVANSGHQGSGELAMLARRVAEKFEAYQSSTKKLPD